MVSGELVEELTQLWMEASMIEGFEDPSDLVAAGYDEAGSRYTEAAERANETKERHTRVVLDRLPEGSRVLDLGCGAGRPTTKLLSKSFRVTGVDVSALQIERARAAVPEAEFIQADMSRVTFERGYFDAVVAFYSIIHVPRDRQQGLVDSIASWLRPGGLMVATLASTADESWTEDDYFGAPMYWSSFDAEENRQMLLRAGFELESADLITQTFDGDEETHLWVVAKRPR